MTAQYRAGDSYVLLGPAAALMVSSDVPIDRVRELWQQVHEQTGLAGLVDTLAGPGASFASIPDFAAALFEETGVRLAVRGPLRAQATSTASTETVSGADVTTWSERFIPGATQVELSEADAAASDSLPFLGGVVRGSWVACDVRAIAGDAPPLLADSPAEPLQPAPAVTPAPAAEPALEPENPPAELDEEPLPIPDHTLVPTETLAAADEPTDILASADEPAGADIDEFEMLFGDTVHTAPGRAEPALGDHDGATITAAEASRLRHAQPSPEPSEDAPTAVLPVTRVGRILLSTGQEVSLDRTVIIGRRPRSTRASGADLPHLVAVESPQQDISRNHLEIRPEGDAVVVIDLHTTNGSTLLRPGNEPVRLHPGEQTLVLTGDSIDLGDGVTVTFQELP